MMRRGCSAVVISLTALSVVYATDYTWNGGASGEWTTPSNWLPDTGYPNAADDTAAFTPSAATAVTIGSAVTVQGITVSGTSALTITGEAITLGSDGITSTSTAAVGISNNLAIATAKTPLAVTGSGTLSSSNPAGPLHLGGVVSGSGGLYKTGSGALHLYGANTFTGNFEAEGNGKRPDGTNVASNKAYTRAASSEVFIYNGSALGAGTATFDRGATTSNIKGCRLTLAEPMTVTTELVPSGDYADGNGSMMFAKTGVYRFKEKVTTPFRLRVGCPDNVEVHYEKEVKCSNWHTNDKLGSTGVFNIYYEGILNVSLLNGSGTSSHVHLMTTGNAFSQSGGLTIHCGVENAYPISRSGVWRWNVDYMKVDLGGYDQKITSIGSYEEKATQHGFLSATPAKVRFVGTGSFAFGGRFYDAAGLEWDPQVAERTLTLTNKTAQTTIGEIEVKSGVLRLSNGATFTKLSSFKLADGAGFEVESGSGGRFLAYGAEIENGGTFTLASGVNLSFGTLTVGTDVIPEGTELTRATHPALISGAGKITVTGARTEAFWTGASGGRWNDAANWSIGQVPDMNYDVVLTNSSVLVDAAIAPVHAITVGDGSTAATITITNDNSTLTANYFTIKDKGVVTCAGPFTNETQMSRVHIVCTNLEIFAGGKIDVTQKGWSGGIWTPEHTVVSTHGFGPGGGGLAASSWAGYSGAWHGGRGSSYWALSKTDKVIYGDAAHPVTAGSGGEMPISWGGEISRLRGWSGGGVVRIEAAKDVTVNGAILANGGGGGVSNSGSSRDTAAAGGSVWITCRTISGAGNVSAEGGSMGDPRMPVTYWRKQDTTDVRYGFPGGGGRIAIDYDPVAQAAADVDGLFVSAAAGEHCSTFSSLATRDNWEDAAESGTLHFTDTALVKRLFGKGLSGRVVGLTGLSFDGDLDFTRGFFQPMEEGFTLSVAGNLTVTSKTARLEVGGVCLTNLSSRPTVWGGRQLNLLTVGGDFTVANGGSFAIRAAETNASMRWGAEVRVTGAMTVGANGYVYASSDGLNLGAPRFLPGSLTVAQGGTLSADKRGGLGLHLDTARQTFGFPDGLHGYYGYGPGGGYKPNAAGHGGKGGRSSAVGSATYGNDNNVYDDEWFPVWPGSGGGCNTPGTSAGNYGAGGTGGGIIHVTTPGAIVVNGTVSADGGIDAYYHTSDWMSNFGAGSGGTVFLFGETFTGGANAKITAKGGDGLQRKNGNNVSATGGGGRIAIWTGYGIHESGTFHTHKRTECPFEFSGSFSAAAGERLVPTNGTQTHTAEELAFSIGGAGTVRFGEYVRIPGARFIIR